VKILIIRLSSIGDIVLTEPVVRCLKEFYPDAEIEYLTKEQYKPLIEFFQGVSKIIPYTNNNQTANLLKDKQYDILIDLHGKYKTWCLKNKLQAKVKVTYNKQHLQRRLIVKKLTKKSIDSTLQLYMSIFSKLKLDVSGKEYQPSLTINTDRKDIRVKMKIGDDEEQKKMVGIFPGALHQTKRYPIKQFAEFIDLCAQGNKFRFVLLGSEKDSPLAREIEDLCQVKPLNWCRKFELKQLIEFISMFDVIITNDSGPMHMAAALNKKQIAIFGATHPKLGFRPLNDKAKIIQIDLSCRPCSLHGGSTCPRIHFKCMKNITPDMLKKALFSFYSS